ncbi:SURF1 family protein [Pseudoduganella sp. LjRoot289]|uniref:SURF1 family protein n=1 Tax=Pseudoduganella sp. LjRoot289 TaxID=3342314 RepID=UPI003ECF9142
MMSAPRGPAESSAATAASVPRLRSAGLRYTLVACAVLIVAVLLALGTWQVQRLQWKLALTARVDARVHAAPLPAPGPSAWAHISAEADEYRHVHLTGTLLPEYATKVQASTERGPGFWLLTPLCVTGGTVLVNRGFVPLTAAAGLDGSVSNVVPVGTDPCVAAALAGRAPVRLNGLLRVSETGKGPLGLRSNAPAENRWYGRDVYAIAAARGLNTARVAPYFVDADAGQYVADLDEAVRPFGGMTVISFPNNHLVYALTWYALAAMMAAALAWAIRDERRRAGRAADA